MLHTLSLALKLFILKGHLPHAVEVVTSLSHTLPHALKPFALKDHLTRHETRSATVRCCAHALKLLNVDALPVHMLQQVYTNQGYRSRNRFKSGVQINVLNPRFNFKAGYRSI